MLIQVRNSKMIPLASSAGRSSISGPPTPSYVGRTRVSGINFDIGIASDLQLESTDYTADDLLGWIPTNRNSLVMVEEEGNHGDQGLRDSQNEAVAGSNSSTCSNTDSGHLLLTKSTENQGSLDS
jgi:hypothetical protein